MNVITEHLYRKFILAIIITLVVCNLSLANDETKPIGVMTRISVQGGGYLECPGGNFSRCKVPDKGYLLISTETNKVELRKGMTPSEIAALLNTNGIPFIEKSKEELLVNGQNSLFFKNEKLVGMSL